MHMEPGCRGRYRIPGGADGLHWVVFETRERKGVERKRDGI
jgi:hypothetical protein